MTKGIRDSGDVLPSIQVVIGSVPVVGASVIANRLVASGGIQHQPKVGSACVTRPTSCVQLISAGVAVRMAEVTHI